MLVVGMVAAILALIPLGLYPVTWLFLMSFGLSIDVAHLGALISVWVGILFNYLLGKILASRVLHD
jgi:hypothetical protein